MSAGAGELDASARLSLLRRLTDVDPGWFVWKNSDVAVRGPGDIDSAAHRQAWPAIVAEFRAWATIAGLGPTIVCRHAPGLLVLVGCSGTAPVRLFQLDVYEHVASVASARGLAAVTEVDGRGFRRLRPGAEGLLRLLGAVRRPGRPPRDRRALERVADLVRSDPEGAETAAGVLGRVGAGVLAGAKPVLAGSWSYRAMLSLEAALLVHGARHPLRRLAWLRFRLGGGARCPVLAALSAGRVVADEPDRWLLEVSAEHDVA